MVKSFREKNWFEIPPCAQPFLEHLFYFREGRLFAENYKTSNENDLLFAWKDIKKIFVSKIDMINNFKPNISAIFHFDRINDI